jgi:dimethylaniline monooxygenase (N-oxide forming)
MNICIVGAGFAGLSTAKILKTFGHSVTVFEKEPDVGGVWSRSRRYPGLTTQNVRSTYAFSDFPYPADYPEWPSGEQVQLYLATYARTFDLVSHIRLDTEVVTARRWATGGWRIEVASPSGSDGERTRETLNFDYLIVCNGIFSVPQVPEYAGAAEFTSAGGRVCHTSQFNEAEDARNKHVLVVGYGKSSCDLAQAVADSAASTTVVVRNLIWKVPKKLMNVLNYKHLLLTRMGEALFRYIRLSGFERFLHGVGRPIRNSLLSQVQWIVTRQCKLEQLGLKPVEPFDTIARSTVSLVTEGFYESAAAGSIRVVKEASVKQLMVVNGVPFAELSDGTTVPADIVICGTGWQQGVPFLDADDLRQVTDATGNFRLYRSMIPIGVSALAFNGYNSSLFSQLNAEVGALWLADLLGGKLRLPPEEDQHSAVTERLAWMEERTDGKHAKGTNIIPFSLHHLDELLADLGMPLSPLTRFKQWFRPIDPNDFAWITPVLLRRHARAWEGHRLTTGSDNM